MALVGYARVSAVGQSLAVQHDKLYHCDKSFQEKASGAAGRRPRSEACLEYVREDDTLVMTRLDRLACSTLHRCYTAAELQRKQLHLQVLDQHIDTADATGRPLFHMLGAIAQCVTELHVERQMDGIQKARARILSLQRQCVSLLGSHGCRPVHIAGRRKLSNIPFWGVGAVSPETPRYNYSLDLYFTDGLRVVLIVDVEYVGADCLELIVWEWPRDTTSWVPNQ